MGPTATNGHVPAAVAEAALEDALALAGQEAGLLRFATAGSVDDGKSTLIGRLLYDSKSVLQDQLDHVEDVSRRRGDDYVDLALLTDGLRAEREQGITIDVAYRYFATPRRRFIIADTPGHEQYTRNMVTGASTADLSIVLVDARRGVTRQSKRHAYVSALLGVPHLVFCVNKMDLVDFDEDAFERVRAEVYGIAERLGVRDVCFIPVSALHGDNVVERSERMDWYEGPTLLRYLEEVHVASDRNLAEARLPVQWVIRPRSERDHDYRGYAGRVAGGILRPGDDVQVLPSGRITRIAAIDGVDGEIDAAFAPMSVTVRLEDELDVSRGDMICHPGTAPRESRQLDADLCWMSDRPLQPRGRYLLKHTTRTVRAVVERIDHRIDIETLATVPAPEGLELNDIARVQVRTAAPLAFDPYERNRETGSFILVDETTNDTVAAGMIRA